MEESAALRWRRGFEQVDNRCERMDMLLEEMIGRRRQADTHFEQVTRPMNRYMVWSFATTLAAGGLVAGSLEAG